MGKKTEKVKSKQVKLSTRMWKSRYYLMFGLTWIKNFIKSSQERH